MKRLIILGVALSLTLFAGVSAYATNNHNPAGNNGFIKINNEEMPDSIPQNHPHVSCTFDVEFYNYDKNNNNATVQFELQAPTNSSAHRLTVKSGNLSPYIGGDAAGGGSDLDAREKYALTFEGPAHQNQGYHVKVTVTAPGSKGSDKKHKVFWVQPCATAAGTSKSTSNNSNQSPLEIPAELPRTGATPILPLAIGSVIGATLYFVGSYRKLKTLL